MLSKDLHILDMSGFIHTGAVNKYARIEGDLQFDEDGTASTKHIPSGGVAYLIKRLVEVRNEFDGDLLIAADRTPTIKRELYPDYKTNRPPNPAIRAQKEIAERMLQDIGLNVAYEDGYEADDIIYTLVKMYKDSYRFIFVHTDDSDNYINTAPNVVCAPVKTVGKICNMRTYPYVCARNKVTEYNTVAYMSTLNGAYKNNVPALPRELVSAWQEVGREFQDAKEFLGDTETVLSYVRKAHPDLAYWFTITYPMIVPELSATPNDAYNFNRLLQWGTLCGYTKGHRTQIGHDLKVIREELLSNPNYVAID